MDHWRLTKRMGNLSSAFKKADRNIQEPPRKLAGNSNKYTFSQYVSP